MLQILVNNRIVELVFSIGVEYALYSLKLGYTNCREYAILLLDSCQKNKDYLIRGNPYFVLVCAKYSAFIAVCLYAHRGIQPLAGRSSPPRSP